MCTEMIFSKTILIVLPIVIPVERQLYIITENIYKNKDNISELIIFIPKIDFC